MPTLLSVKKSSNGDALGAALALAAIVGVALIVGLYVYRMYWRRPPAPARSVIRTVPPKKPRAGHQAKKAPRAAPSPQSGFEIIGLLKNRPIIRKVLPTYPLWAEEQGISGKVKLAFRVENSGDVASNIWVTQTIGYPDIDRLAVDALKRWRFAPLPPPDAVGEQSGMIRFDFTLETSPPVL